MAACAEVRNVVRTVSADDRANTGETERVRERRTKVSILRTAFWSPVMARKRGSVSMTLRTCGMSSCVKCATACFWSSATSSSLSLAVRAARVQRSESASSPSKRRKREKERRTPRLVDRLPDELHRVLGLGNLLERRLRVDLARGSLRLLLRLRLLLLGREGGHARADLLRGERRRFGLLQQLLPRRLELTSTRRLLQAGPRANTVLRRRALRLLLLLLSGRRSLHRLLRHDGWRWHDDLRRDGLHARHAGAGALLRVALRLEDALLLPDERLAPDLLEGTQHLLVQPRELERDALRFGRRVADGRVARVDRVAEVRRDAVPSALIVDLRARVSRA